MTQGFLSSLLAYSENTMSKRAKRKRPNSKAESDTSKSPMRPLSFEDEKKRNLSLTEFDIDSNDPLLLLGKSGSGKSYWAETIHNLSKRKKEPFYRVNCATMPEGVFASEIFGHKKGAFTGADTDKTGLIALAGEGTLFLDEIDQANIRNQASLLTLLDSGKYRSVGGAEELQSKARIIAASNVPLELIEVEERIKHDVMNRFKVRAIPGLKADKRRFLEIMADILQKALGKHHPKGHLYVSEEYLQEIWSSPLLGEIWGLKNALDDKVKKAGSWGYGGRIDWRRYRNEEYDVIIHRLYTIDPTQVLIDNQEYLRHKIRVGSASVTISCPKDDQEYLKNVKNGLSKLTDPSFDKFWKAFCKAQGDSDKAARSLKMSRNKFNRYLFSVLKAAGRIMCETSGDGKTAPLIQRPPSPVTEHPMNEGKLIPLEELRDYPISRLRDVPSSAQQSRREKETASPQLVREEFYSLTPKQRKEKAQRTIEQCGGNKTKAAAKLGINRSTLYSYIQEK